MIKRSYQNKQITDAIPMVNRMALSLPAAPNFC